MVRLREAGMPIPQTTAMAKQTMIHVGHGSHDDLEAIANAVRLANRVVVLLGAGVSTAAGIPVRDSILAYPQRAD